MHHPKAVLVFSKPLSVARGNKQDPFSLVAWNDVDMLYSSMLADTVATLEKISGCDVFLYSPEKKKSPDVASMFSMGIEARPYAANRFDETVAAAIDSAFQEGHQRVIVLLEPQPLLQSDLVKTVFAQLGMEDDCMVVGCFEDGDCYLVGLKSNYASAFLPSTVEKSPNTSLFQRLCNLDTMLAPLPTSYSVQSTLSLHRLRLDIEARTGSSGDFPHRTHESFKLLHRKYKIRYSKQ